MIGEAGFVRATAEPMLGGLVDHPQRAGRFDARLVIHLWRLLKWGRTLARHGALRGIERDPLTPPQVRRLARIARFGARVPPTPDYAAALQAIGPAAIKLGQALSTRPDLVGAKAAENLSQLQDNLPPAPFAAIKQTIETSFGAPLDSSVLRVRRDADRRGLDRPGSQGDDHRRPRSSRSRCFGPVSRMISPGRSTPTNGPRRMSRLWAASSQRLRPRLVVAQFKQWTTRELDLQREAASASELRENMVAEPGYLRARDRLAADRAPGADARMARRHQAQRSRGADRGRA